MNKITVTLKQHTPLLHFQPMQEGATLRASEVKPKLDKFLLTQLGLGDYEKGVEIAKEKGWLIGNGANGCKALNYKMRIEGSNPIIRGLKISSKKNGKVETDSFPFVLSNMGGKDNVENVANFTLYEKCTLTLTFVGGKNVDELISTIMGTDEIPCPIALFFANNNFGQRSTKGFGSFMVEKISDGIKTEFNYDHISSFIPSGTPMLKYKVKNNDTFMQSRTLFEVLDYYWKLLKSGVNYRKGYIKSYLWKYLNQNGFTWEKREIKQQFELYEDEKEIKDNDNTPTFGRALLGLPDKFEYRFAKDTVPVNISSISKRIERIASPIIFKPFVSGEDVTVYILRDKSLINSLAKLNKEDCQFDFECENQHMKMNIAPNSINHLELIQDFHAYINKNSKKYSNGNDWSFIPRNFRWDNILGKTNNKDNLVYLRQKA